MRRKVSGQSWRLCAAAAGLAILGLARGPAWAQQPAQAPPDATDLRSRIERLEKQNDELLRTLQDLKQSGQRPDSMDGRHKIDLQSVIVAHDPEQAGSWIGRGA